MDDGDTACELAEALAGNIGLPLLELIDESAEAWAIELSSYQTSDMSFLPDIAAVTNLYPEHVDWHGSLAAYTAEPRATEMLPNTLSVAKCFGVVSSRGVSAS